MDGHKCGISLFSTDRKIIADIRLVLVEDRFPVQYVYDLMGIVVSKTPEVPKKTCYRSWKITKTKKQDKTVFKYY